MTAISLATDKKVRTVLYALLFAIVGTIVLRSCSNDGFDFRTSARLTNPFLVLDTALKPKVSPPPVRYTLSGMSDTLVKTLWMQLTVPDDVTENQKKVLRTWIQQNIKIDTAR